MSRTISTAILISGRGSNMKSLIEASRASDFPARIDLVLSNKDNAEGLLFAQKEGINVEVVDNKNFINDSDPRENFDRTIDAQLKKHSIELVCLAGFMRLLSPWFVNEWFDRLINIHPSLLPAFKGANAVFDALQAGVKISGCTTHFVRSEMDSGPIIMQSAVPIIEGDTKEILASRILQEEHRIYPATLKLLASKLLL